jgi:small subunit ribosomal protein S21
VTSQSTVRRASNSVAAAAVAVAGMVVAAQAGEGITNVHVEPREGESFDQFLRRFKTSMDKSGILREYKRKRYFKSNGELQREKAKAAARRRTKRFRGPRPLRPAAR